MISFGKSVLSHLAADLQVLAAVLHCLYVGAVAAAATRASQRNAGALLYVVVVIDIPSAAFARKSNRREYKREQYLDITRSALQM